MAASNQLLRRGCRLGTYIRLFNLIAGMNISSTHIRPGAVLFLSIAAFLIPILFIEVPILQFTHGSFAYPIDDTCIHLSIAKNLAEHGVWGTYSGEFSSSASSILYPLVLALLIKIVGAHLWLPFFVNFITSIVLLIVIQKWLLKQAIVPVSQFIVLCGVIFLTPLAPLAISGMEHVLQFLFTFLFVTRLSTDLAISDRSAGKSWRLSPAVYLFGLLMVSTRYECMAILGLASFFLLLKKRIMTAIGLFIFGIIPIIIFGIYSMRHGNFFFPNSVLLKQETPELNFDSLYSFFTHDLFYRLYYSVVGYNSIATQRCLFLLLLSFLIFQSGLREKPEWRYMLLLLIAAIFIHLSFTGHARFPRYEAYLIGCAIPLLGVLCIKYGRALLARNDYKSDHGQSLIKHDLGSWIMWVTVLFVAFPLVLRSNDAFDQVEEGSYSTYKVLYTAGDFLHRYYNHDAVALECLGAMSYFSDGKKMDVVGLGDIEVTKRARAHLYTIGFLDSLSKIENVQIAAGTPISTPPALLNRWIRVGTWYLPIDQGGAYISFYAVNPHRADELKRNLVNYERFLPAGEKAAY
jgi:hypothetical protein